MTCKLYSNAQISYIENTTVRLHEYFPLQLRQVHERFLLWGKKPEPFTFFKCAKALSAWRTWRGLLSVSPSTERAGLRHTQGCSAGLSEPPRALYRPPGQPRNLEPKGAGSEDNCRGTHGTKRVPFNIPPGKTHVQTKGPHGRVPKVDHWPLRAPSTPNSDTSPDCWFESTLTYFRTN